MSKLKSYTYKELYEMSIKELRKLQRSLGQYIGTSDEKNARRLNHAIMATLDSKSGYGL